MYTEKQLKVLLAMLGMKDVTYEEKIAILLQLGDNMTQQRLFEEAEKCGVLSKSYLELDYSISEKFSKLYEKM